MQVLTILDFILKHISHFWDSYTWDSVFILGLKLGLRLIPPEIRIVWYSIRKAYTITRKGRDFYNDQIFFKRTSLKVWFE